jgi:hypothetical protein
VEGSGPEEAGVHRAARSSVVSGLMCSFEQLCPLISSPRKFEIDLGPVFRSPAANFNNRLGGNGFGEIKQALTSI